MVLLSRANWRSPCRTWISTPGCLSEAVEKISDLRVGIVVLRSINLVNTPSRVSLLCERVGLLAQIHSLLFFELVENPIHEAIIPIVTAEMRVAVGGLHLEHAVADF